MTGALQNVRTDVSQTVLIVVAVWLAVLPVRNSVKASQGERKNNGIKRECKWLLPAPMSRGLLARQ